jgi:hypothetical protein
VHVLGAAARALGEVASECGSAAQRDIDDGTDMTRQYSSAVPTQVRLTVPTHHIGEVEVEHAATYIRACA